MMSSFHKNWTCWIFDNCLVIFLVYPPLPTTLTDEEWRKNQIKRMIDMRINPIDGFSSKYDYDNNKWKDQ